mgnify:CR=1 FL=1
MYIKKGDKVQVLSGKDRGKQGVVLRALPAENKVVVEGVSVVKKAVKPNAANQQGGIVSQEAPIDASNVGHEKDGKNKLRVCKKCGHKF